MTRQELIEALAGGDGMNDDIFTTIRTVEALIEMPLTQDDLDRAEGNVTQAVQNAIGHTGAQVICAGDDCP